MSELVKKDATGTDVAPALIDAISDLTAEEQEVLIDVVRAAKYQGDVRTAIDDVSIVREFLKVDMSQIDPTIFEEISSMKAPPVIKEYRNSKKVQLPESNERIGFTIDEVLKARASRRDFNYKAQIELKDLATLLNLSYGVRGQMMAYNTSDFPLRYAPTSGGLQSVEIYLAVNDVKDCDRGIYHYNPKEHSLELMQKGNFRRKVLECCTYQDFIEAAGAVLILTCDMNKLYWKYGKRSYRFVHIDTGIVSQNIHLVATSLRLRSCMIAGYIDDEVNQLLEIDGQGEFAVLLIAIGKKPWFVADKKESVST